MIPELDDLQARVAVWKSKNFGVMPDTLHAAKLLEEAGEAGHAIVRLYHQEQGKKVNPKSEANLRDALGDIVIVLMNIANNHGWLLSEVIQDTLDEVLARDYSERA